MFLTSPTQDMFYILQALSSMNDSPLNIWQQIYFISTMWSLGYSLIAWFIFSLSINIIIGIKIFSDFTISNLIMFSPVKYCRPHILRSHKQMAHFSVLVDFNIIKFLVRTLWRVHCPNSLDHIKKYDVVVKTPK